MTTCERCRERLIDHHYGELALADARETAEHLADCASCALEYCRLSAVLSGFREIDREAPSAELHRELRAKVVQQFKPSLSARIARLFAVKVPLYQPALLLIVFVVLWTLVRGIEPSATNAPTVLERYDATRVEIVDQHVL